MMDLKTSNFSPVHAPSAGGGYEVKNAVCGSGC
jgi:hypothetical protein